MEQDNPEQRRHSFLQEEARMLGPIYRANDAKGHQWRQRALCAALVEDTDTPIPPNIFFAKDGTDASEAAVQVCFECPVRLDCLQWSCVAKQRHGIFGGLPASVRLQGGVSVERGRPHDYTVLAGLPNPYLTENPRSRFHRDNIQLWEGEEDE